MTDSRLDHYVLTSSDSSPASSDEVLAPAGMLENLYDTIEWHGITGLSTTQRSAYPYGMLELFDDYNEDAQAYYGVLLLRDRIAMKVAHIALHTLSWDDKNTDCFLPLDVMNEVVGQLSEMNATEYATLEYRPPVATRRGKSRIDVEEYARSIAAAHVYRLMIVTPLLQGYAPHKVPYDHIDDLRNFAAFIEYYQKGYKCAFKQYKCALDARQRLDTKLLIDKSRAS